MQNPRLIEAWGRRLELLHRSNQASVEADELLAKALLMAEETEVLLHSNVRHPGELGAILRRSNKLYKESKSLRDSARAVWLRAVSSVYGDVSVSWLVDGSCHLGNGDLYEQSGRATIC